jgi:hypothetical protein
MDICIFTLPLFWLDVSLDHASVNTRQPEIIMPKQMTSDEMATLLKILDTAERTIEKVPGLNNQKSTEFWGDDKPGLGNVATTDRNTNHFVEQIAAAMTKFRVQGRPS